ncbi:MAG TPA: RodZ domain-containing protein [Steroidobacteraceae bacterium]|nr:RodZ domain-containing protein [Steroidobacteraceae bacterium]
MAVEAGGIGARLRAGREKLGLTVLQVAERIHTDPKIVEAIEAENYEALGAPVYARGHIGHYAELVGESGSELNQLYSRQSKVAQPDLTRIVKAPAGTNSSKLVAPALLVIAVFAVAGAIWWVSALSKKKPQLAETHVVGDEEASSDAAGAPPDSTGAGGPESAATPGGATAPGGTTAAGGATGRGTGTAAGTGTATSAGGASAQTGSQGGPRAPGATTSAADRGSPPGAMAMQPRPGTPSAMSMQPRPGSPGAMTMQPRPGSGGTGGSANAGGTAPARSGAASGSSAATSAQAARSTNSGPAAAASGGSARTASGVDATRAGSGATSTQSRGAESRAGSGTTSTQSRAAESRTAPGAAAAPQTPTRVASASPTRPTAASVAPAPTGAPAASAAASVPEAVSAPPRAKNQSQITLRYSSDSWTEVYDASGARLFYDVGAANSVQTVVGTPPLRVVLGNASGVSVEYNGHSKPIAKMSRPDGSVQFSINRSGQVVRAKPVADGG